MSARKRNSSFTRHNTTWSRRVGLLICLAFVAVSGGPIHADVPPDSGGLNYFKNFFVTGNYATASVDFGSQSGGNGLVTATITTGQLIPNDADVVGAFLYWQTIVGAETPLGQPIALPPGVHPTFRTYALNNPDDPNGPVDLAKLVSEVSLLSTFSPCWSGGGGTANKMRTYRADVRRLLPYVTDPTTGLPIGKAIVNNQSFQVQLPDNGTGNQTPQTAGATLLIIYRLPTETLKSVVLYDGLQIKPDGPPATTTRVQTLRGFYDASATPGAKLTILAGSGAKNTTDQVLFGNGSEISPIATNPFFTRDTNSPGSDRAWDGVTFPRPNTTDLPLDMSSLVWTPYGQQVTVQVKHTSASPYDCLATSAMIFSTEVDDRDFDGLLDVWETGDISATIPTHAPLLEPTGQPLPDLYAMQADPDQQDIFFQLAFMSSPAYNDPLGQVVAHTHRPSAAVLNDIATVLKGNAQGMAPPPRYNPANPTAKPQTTAIKVHFDVGNVYQGDNFVPAALAEGGDELTETLECTVQENNCSFPGFHGVVGWKRGFQALKEELQLFNHNRRHIFRFVLLAHALGLPRDDDPTTTTVNESKWPRSISGASDGGDGGGDFIVTLGQWDNNTGTDFVQKSTFVHEFGHTMGLRHGGQESTATFAAVNCKPSYLSVMNYLFQIRGLIGPTAAIDYSRQDLQLRTGLTGNAQSDLNEASLRETELRVEGGTASAFYGTRWYAPQATSLLDNLPGPTGPQVATSASTRHCDGSPLRPDELVSGQTETPMVRIDGTYPSGRIDWNASGTLDSSPLPVYPQDINYNGDGPGSDPAVLPPTKDGTFTGWDDWSHVDLRQVGARRVPGIMSLEIARNELPEDDPIFGDWGYGDWGYGDWGYGDWGYGDWGYGDWGYGDWGYGDWGYGDDIDEATATSQGPAANSLSYTTTNQAIILRWQGPQGGGTVLKFEVWRALNAISNNNLPTNLTLNGVLPILPACTKANPVDPSSLLVCTYTDSTAQNNRPYFYFVMTEFASGQRTRSEILPASR
jgi:hypothetical protein